MLDRALFQMNYSTKNPLIVVRGTLMRESMKRRKRNDDNNDIVEFNLLMKLNVTECDTFWWT